ncbi:MAG: hypothetical protein FWD69_14785 [Polyangiaceae bacterium]|nr:hypothetical protein [Polyangiaceae bacterium]
MNRVSGVKVAVRTLDELGEEIVLAPERHLMAARSSEGVRLDELVTERNRAIDVAPGDRVVIVDTTHAKDGVLNIASAARAAGSETRSVSRRKKLAFAGDVIVSRLRPYLRQIALIHPDTLAKGQALALSTEFYVLAPARKGDDIAFLIPFLLSSDVQSALADAQEGGHHPRVPPASLFALRVPHALVGSRHPTSAIVRRALARYYEAARTLRSALGT